MTLLDQPGVDERLPRRHPVLQRQLRRAGLLDALPDPDSWSTFVDSVDRSYCDHDEGLRQLERSLGISSREIRELTLDMERSSESLLAHERDRLRLLFDSVTTGLLVIDRFGRITSVNPEAERLFGTASSLVDHYLEHSLHMVGRDGEPRPLVSRDELDRALRAGRWVRNDIRLVDPRVAYQHLETPDGTIPAGVIAADVAIVAFRAGDAHLGGLVVVTDNAIREEARSKLAWQASHDALTSLPNRLLLAERTEVALVQARRTGRWPSVLFLDLDRFKYVNDSLGHAAGDRLLVAAADRLLRCVRRSDTVARTGGDEFVVLCDGVEDPSEVRFMAERILNALNDPFDLGADQAFVSASIGMAHGNETLDADALLKDADLAMYRSKELGGSRIEVADDHLREAAAERMKLERSLRSAVMNEDLTVAYQPVLRVDTGELIGFEVLARWHHPTLGEVPPKRFISVAEDIGLMVAIGDRVLDTACRDIAAWNEARLQHRIGASLTMQVNISGRELASPSLIGRVIEAMRRHDVSHDTLTLDIAEDVLLHHGEVAASRLTELDDAGIKVAIDDFGSGHSSLASLRRFPVHLVKIDRGFIAGIDRSARDERVVRALVDLAHALGCIVSAEGVETIRELGVLRTLGCDYAQGYLLGKPLTADEAFLLATATASGVTPQASPAPQHLDQLP
jgi:diguanylate cyclase (GGDEF)-like protein